MPEIDILQYILVRRAHGPSWSHDASQLAFVADTSGLDQAWLLDMQTREQRQFTQLLSASASSHGLPKLHS